MKFEWLTADHDPAEPGKEQRFGFECPKHPDQMCTGLIIRGRGIDVPNKTWAWDGNRAAPTFSPSINCAGCSHGYIKAGVWQDA